MSRIRYSHRKEGPYIAMQAKATIDGKEYTIKRLIHPAEIDYFRLEKFWLFRQEAKGIRDWIRRRVPAEG